jgi:CHASE1-domain containing sensor protein
MHFKQYRPRLRLLSILSILILVVLAVLTVLLNSLLIKAIQQKAINGFAWDSGLITSSVQGKLNNYSDVLYDGRSFVLNSQVVTPSEWAGFYHSQDVFNRFPGMSTISYVQLVTAAQKNQFITEKRKMPEFGPNYTINPSGDREVYAVGTLIVSDANNVTLSGFDVYSTPDRKAVYDAAVVSGQPTASGEITFANTTTKGLYATLPVTNQGITRGFVVVALHEDDLFKTIVDESKLGIINLKVTDVTDSKTPTTYYKSANWSDNSHGLSRSDSITFGGRKWHIDYQAPAHYTYHLSAILLPLLVLGSGLISIFALILVFYVFFRTVPVSRLKPEHLQELHRKRDI